MGRLVACGVVVAATLVAPGTLAAGDFLSTGGYRSDGAALVQPAVSLPARGGSYVDPVFGTTVRRLTATPQHRGVVPEYSKAQAWNADMSRLLLHGVDGGWLLYDGRTFDGPLPLDLPVGDIEPRWSPSNPDRLTYLMDTGVYRYSVRARRSALVLRTRALGAYLTSGAEQEVSRDGRYFALHGPVRENARGQTISTRVAVVDLAAGRLGPVKTLRAPRGAGGDALDYLAITPDGRLVMAMWANHGADLYRRRDWRFVRRLTTWDEHGDFCRDAAGRWWFVQARYRPQPNDEVVEASSLTGLRRRTLWRAPRFNLALHVSCRNTALPGWAYLSSYWDGIGQRPGDGPTPFENEVFALSLASTVDTPIVRRFAHTRMVERADYYDEPHATVRQDGRVVLFGSNGGRRVADEDSADTLAIELG